MKLLTSGKPEVVADKAKFGRQILQEPFLDVAKKMLYVANTAAAIRLPVEIEDGDTSGPVTKAALVAARKAKTDSIRADGSLSITGKDGTVTLPRPEVGEFPNIDAVTPAEYEQPFRIALDSESPIGHRESHGRRSGCADLQQDIARPERHSCHAKEIRRTGARRGSRRRNARHPHAGEGHMSFATCRGCGASFTTYGMGAQSRHSPRLCCACAVREAAYHGYHAPGMKCLDEFLGTTKEKKTLEGTT